MKYICVQAFSEIWRIRQVKDFRLWELNWLMRNLSSHVFSPTLGCLVWRKWWRKERFTLPRGCFHSPLEGGRTSSALGMCVDTQIMWWPEALVVLQWPLGSTTPILLVSRTNKCSEMSLEILEAWAPSGWSIDISCRDNERLDQLLFVSVTH